MSIIVKPIQATLARNTELFTKMDPYCKIYLGGQCQQTNVCHKGGKTPIWNSTLTFSNSSDMTLRVEVWDHETIGHDDLVGIGNLNLMNVMHQGSGNSVWVDLIYNGANVGRVCLSIQMNNIGMGMNMGGMNTHMGVNPIGGVKGLANNPLNNNSCNQNPCNNRW